MSSAQEIIYYSNYCPHCIRIIDFLTRSDLIRKVQMIPVDKRWRDPVTGQDYVVLQNGAKKILPPNIHSVPAMLLMKRHYEVLYGNEITQYFEKEVGGILSNPNSANVFQQIERNEPSGFSLGGPSIDNFISASHNNYKPIQTNIDENYVKQRENPMKEHRIHESDSSAVIAQLEAQRRKQDMDLGLINPATNMY
jgi:hypothetical protein